MKTPLPCRRRRGYVSYALVIATAMVLTSMLLFSYKSAVANQTTQATASVRADFTDKEDAVLRAIVSIAPNRAMRAMMHNSNSSSTTRDPLRWQNIFTDAMTQANARTALSATVISGLNLGDVTSANPANAPMTGISGMFDAIEPESGYCSPGINRSLGAGFPIPLNCDDYTTSSRDATYPIISNYKYYGSLANGLTAAPVATFPKYNLIPYPNIRFGYAQPGQLFVAKRNWWAFSMSLEENDNRVPGLPIFERDFVLSIYEIPAQLAITAATFAALGQHASGTPWQNVSIEGGVYANKSVVEAPMNLQRLAGRRGMNLGSATTVGGQTMSSKPFEPGVREQYEVVNNDYMPVSLSSESGRVAFVPVNRGADYFDRFAHTAESNAVSTTTWNEYSAGALQCAMRLDVTDVVSDTNQTPTRVRFSYFKAGLRVTQDYGVDVVGWENMTPRFPFSMTMLYGVKPCLIVRPELFAPFLASLGANDTTVNHSLVVNVDYPSNPTKIRKPAFPCLDNDIGLIMTDCDDLTAFTKGFSLVTNMRLYVADDFNVTTTTPPVGSGLPSPYYPPVSLFAPERRFGAEIDPYRVNIGGQLGSIAGDSQLNPVRMLDLKLASSQLADPGRITVNLKPIAHPAALPPVNMINWLIVIQERRREFYGEGASGSR